MDEILRRKWEETEPHKFGPGVSIEEKLNRLERMVQVNIETTEYVLDQMYWSYLKKLENYRFED